MSRIRSILAVVTAGAVLLSGVPAHATGITATVITHGGALNARSGASTADRVVAAIAPGTRLAVRCQVYGQLIRGAVRLSPFWELRTDGSYVADAYVRWWPARPIVAWCAGDAPASATVRTGGGRLTVRDAPRPSAAKIGTLAPGSPVRVLCAAWGAPVAGTSGNGPIWYG